MGKIGLIRGQPGVGKSCIALFTIASLSKSSKGWSFLWVHLDGIEQESLLHCFLIRSDGTTGKLRTSPEDFQSLLNSWSDSAVNSFLILDGISDGSKGQWDLRTIGHMWAEQRKENRRMLCISSDGYKLNIRDGVVNESLYRLFQQWSWTWDDYCEAFKHPELKDAVKGVMDAPLEVEDDPTSFNDSIEAKYYYAGGSARYMFSFSTNQIIEAIKRAISDLPRGCSTELAAYRIRDRLLSYFGPDDSEPFVSGFAKMTVLRNLSTKWIREMGIQLGLSRKVQGSFFQSWVVRNVKDGVIRDILKHNGHQIGDWWTCTNQVYHRAFKHLTLQNTTPDILIDSTFDQEPSIDSLFWTKTDKGVSVHLFKITIAEKHKLDVKVCSNLANQFSATTVNVYFIIPTENNKFDVSPLENAGELKQFGWPEDENLVREKLLGNVLRIEGWK